MSLTFVRRDMLPPLAPPPGQRGLVKWLRENLFSSVLNTGLTLVAAFAVYHLVSAVAVWLSHGVWTAASLRECRDIIATAFGSEASGPCWAMVRLRWNQFLFGLYPVVEYWRPVTALALFLVALAPVLYFGQRKEGLVIAGAVTLGLALGLWGIGADPWHLWPTVLAFVALALLAWLRPRLLVWLTLAFPALAYSLLWGGSIWGPIVAMAGFAVLALVWIAAQPRIGAAAAFGAGVAAALVWWAFLQSPVTGALQSLLPLSLPYVRSDDFGGFLLAFVIGVAAITASLPIGILLSLGRLSDMPLVKALSVWYIEFFRGVPLITVLFSANYMLLYFLPPGTNFDLILRVIIVVTIFASAYIAEVVRGGLAALPRGQFEAADALGLTYWQAQRLIVMPQALKISIPGIVSSFIGLFKDTTLVALVGLMDPLQGVTRVVRHDPTGAWKGIYWEPYIFVGAIFFVVCFSMSRYSMYLERKLKTDR